MNQPFGLPSSRALSWVAITYLMVIIALAIPRVQGASWRSMMLPGDMRNLEGFPVHWESHIQLRSVRAMSASDSLNDLIKWFSTDEYRATLPIYLASVIRQLTGSYVLGVTASEVIWWWSGSLAVFLLARQFLSTPTAFAAGILTTASPLSIGHLGSASLHTASSLSLSVFLLIAWRLLYNDRIAFVSKVALYGVCLYLSSITYTYQWFLAPFFIVVAAIPRFSRDRVNASVLGISAFLALRWVSYGVLALGGLEVHAHTNDPLRIIRDRLPGDFALVSGQWDAVRAFLTETVVNVVLGTVSSYHIVVVVCAAIGLGWARDARFSVASGTAISLGFAFGAIYGVPWVLMSGYPFVYALAAHGMTGASRALATRLPLLRDNQYAPHALLALSTLIVASLTNLDLVGDPTFAIGWWRSWYTPH